MVFSSSARITSIKYQQYHNVGWVNDKSRQWLDRGLMKIVQPNQDKNCAKFFNWHFLFLGKKINEWQMNIWGRVKMYCGGVRPKSGRLSDWLKVIVILLCGIVFSPVFFCVFCEIKICVHGCRRDGKISPPYFVLYCFACANFLGRGFDLSFMRPSLPFQFCFRLPVDGFPYIEFSPPFLFRSSGTPNRPSVAWLPRREAYPKYAEDPRLDRG